MKTLQKILIILILQLFCFQLNCSAQDSITIARPLKHKFQAEPLKATMLAVVFPGFGQIYNRKLWKIPLVYAGFGGLIFSAGFNSSHYNLYMKAYQDLTDNLPATKSYEKLILAPPESYDPKTQAGAGQYAYYKDQMLRTVDYYKRYRDLSYIGIGGWYLLSILDANVDASLFNYDVSDNLDVAVFPVQVPLPGGYLGAGLSVSLKVTF